MNIFVLDSDPAKAVHYLCDKHVIKMILESFQMLCTVLRHYGLNDSQLYKSTHVKHPCVLWLIESRSNYVWLLDHLEAMQKEYYLRYLKVHASYRKLWNVVNNIPENYPELGLTKFRLAMPDQYKRDDPILSYRLYYIGEKLKFAKWSPPSEVPDWIIKDFEEKKKRTYLLCD